MEVTWPCLVLQPPFPTSFTSALLSPQGLPISMYGGTLIPSHPQLADGPGGPLFNGLHTPDPAWNPMIKVVQNSTECTDAQQVVWLPFPACAFLGLYTMLWYPVLAGWHVWFFQFFETRIEIVCMTFPYSVCVCVFIKYPWRYRYQTFQVKWAAFQHCSAR